MARVIVQNFHYDIYTGVRYTSKCVIRKSQTRETHFYFYEQIVNGLEWV